MCATCGCEGKEKATLRDMQTGTTRAIPDARPHHDPHADEHRHWHVHPDGTAHSHPQDNGELGTHLEHQHRRGHLPLQPPIPGEGRAGTLVSIEARILAKNDAIAANNRAWLRGREILALNMVSSPGAGKTTLLERTIAGLAGRLRCSVIVGDQATTNDGERIRNAGAAAVQVNTGTGCHLDADMIARGLAEIRPPAGSVIFIENVGNLVCPALFDLGEQAKVVIFSTAEGEDKPLKYPHAFRAASLVVLNKVDLTQHLGFSLMDAKDNVRQINSQVPILEVSARTGDGLQAWYDWIEAQVTIARQLAFVPTELAGHSPQPQKGS